MRICRTKNEAGQSEEVPSEALTNLFKILGKNIRCVVLNACYSERQAKAIATHVDFVAGMVRTICDDAAKDFAVYFYQALGFGKSIKDAFDLGRNQLELSNIPEDHTPKLNVREGVDPSRIFLVNGKSFVVLDVASEAVLTSSSHRFYNQIPIHKLMVREKLPVYIPRVYSKLNPSISRCLAPCLNL
ncbi:MAG: hypothetical protein WAM14_14140 [Candidatus Nitrosopolaris sp.]